MLTVLATSACSKRDDRSGIAAVRGTLASEPAILIAPPSDRVQGVLHGRLFVRADRDLPEGAVIRVVQGVDEGGRFLFGEELRYGLTPVPQFGGRAWGVGARIVDRASRAELAILPVASLAPDAGWLAIGLDRALPASAEVELLLGDPKQPGIGPPTTPLPIEVELAADVRFPAAPDLWHRLEGRVPVRIAPASADWLRVLAPSQVAVEERPRLTIVFQHGLSGPQRSSLDALVPAGTLELRGPFPAFTHEVAAESPSPTPRAVSLELPPLPPGLHRIEVRFRGERELRGLSNPIAAGATTTPLFFGSIHNHTTVGGHATGTHAGALRYARDVAALDFVAISEHREAPGFDGARFARLAAEESRPDRFVVFTAWEWTDPRAGHRHVLHRSLCEPPPAPPDLHAFASSVGRDPEVLVAGHHSLWNGGAAQKRFDWGEPGLLPRQRLAEVYSWHGCSLAHESAFPLHGNHDQEFPPELHTDVASALARGHRLFLVADGDGHLGKPGSLVGIQWPRGRRYAFQGLIAVSAPLLERGELFDAMDRGAVYGTTGARIRLHARRDGADVGAEIAATAPLARVTLRSPRRTLAEERFDPVARDLGDDAAALYLDPARGAWDAQLELTAPEGLPDEPWILELAQQDGHHAWMLLPPATW